MSLPLAERVAIVVPSIAVDPLLVRCVRECRRLYPEVRIVALVDDGTGRERLDAATDVVVTGPSTIGAKRNRAVAALSTDAVAFIDSDAYPEAGWLEAAVAHLDAAGDEVAAVGGPNVAPPTEPWDQRAVGRAHLSPLVCGWWTHRKRRGAPARDVPMLPSCNLVVRRAAYLDLGGMDEHLFTAEDTDFCRRLQLSGRRIRFEPDVVVVHKNRGLRAYLVQRYTFGVAMVPLIASATAPEARYTAVSALPALLVAGLAAGPVLAGSPPLRRLWTIGAGAFALAVGVEAVRCAGRPRDVPATGLAIAVGNLAPGAGIWARLAGASRDLRGTYRNDR